MDYSKMTLREKILQTFVVTIREINKHGGIEEFFSKYPVGGLYFNESKQSDCNDEIELNTCFSAKTLRKCRQAAGDDLLICADEAMLPAQTEQISIRPLGSSKNEEDAYNIGKVYGMQMNEFSVDWVLGPCIDMLYTKNSPFLSMSDSPKVTEKLYGAVVKGIQDQGVCATIKHFPGLGTYKTNMHHAPGKNILPFDEWMNSYGNMYKNLIDQGVKSIMTTHCLLECYCSEKENGFLPIATYSTELTTKLLKGKLGFDGAVVTDALIMGGNATGDFIGETVQAFKAGADLLLWPPVEAAEEIEKRILSGEIPMSRLEDALSRIEKMREFRKTSTHEKPDLDFIMQTIEKTIENGVCLYKNQNNMLPLNESSMNNLLLVEASDDPQREMSELLKKHLEKFGCNVDIKTDIYDKVSRVCWPDEITELQSHYDAVIFNINTDYIANCWQDSYMLIWASHMFDKSKKIIINFGSPFFAEDYFPEDPTIIEVNNPPTEIAAQIVAEGLFGKREFLGKPVLNNDI